MTDRQYKVSSNHSRGFCKKQWSSCLDHECQPHRFHQGQMGAWTMITATDFWGGVLWEVRYVTGPDCVDLGWQSFCRWETPEAMTSLSEMFFQKDARPSSSRRPSSRNPSPSSTSNCLLRSVALYWLTSCTVEEAANLHTKRSLPTFIVLKSMVNPIKAKFTFMFVQLFLFNIVKGILCTDYLGCLWPMTELSAHFVIIASHKLAHWQICPAARITAKTQ